VPHASIVLLAVRRRHTALIEAAVRSRPPSHCSDVPTSRSRHSVGRSNPTIPLTQLVASGGGAAAWGEHTFRALIENAMDIIVLLDEHGEMRYGSPAVRRVLGYARRELVGRAIQELVHPDDQAGLQAAMRRILAQHGGETTLELRVRHSDGEFRWIEAVARNLVQDPVVGGIVVNAREVTDRRRTMQALEASDQRFRLAFEASPIAMFLSTPEGVITRSNGAFCDVLGYSPEEIEELGWSAITHPDDRARSNELHLAMQRGEIEEYQFEKRYLHKDGHYVWVLLTASLVRDRSTSAPSYFFAQVHDIGERKRAEEMLRVTEERFKLLGRATRDLVYDWDMPSETLYWSDTLFTIFGHTAEQVRPTIDWWAEQIHPDDRERVAASLDRAIDAGADSWSEEYRFRRGDSSWATVNDRGYLVYGDDGRAVRMIGAMADITEQKDLEAHLRQAQKMDAIGRLAGGIAHDFNNLLTVISTNCELILSDVPPDAPVASDVGEIRDAAQRAAGLTRQLLAFSRRQMLELSVIDVNEVIVDMEKMLRRVLGETVALQVDLSDDLGFVRADRNQLEQILLNLVVNARDAMSRGGSLSIATADVEIDQATARRRAGFRPGTYIELRVTDTGSGMSPDVLARAFEPFFTTKDVGKGTGLGLSTVYGIVKQSHGFVYIDSVVGEGTTFHVFLPRLTDEMAAADGWDTSVSEPCMRDWSEEPTVLLVEDEDLVRSVVRRSLERYGYEVIEARSAHEALALEARYRDRIDIVLSDVVMPGMSGRALAVELSARRPSLPVVFMSGYPDEDDGIVSLPETCGPVLQKPVQIDELLTRLQEQLQRHVKPA
jgi:PAS domain S-box-containing protein